MHAPRRASRQSRARWTSYAVCAWALWEFPMATQHGRPEALIWSERTDSAPFILIMPTIVSLQWPIQTLDRWSASRCEHYHSAVWCQSTPFCVWPIACGRFWCRFFRCTFLTTLTTSLQLQHRWRHKRWRLRWAWHLKLWVGFLQRQVRHHPSLPWQLLLV